jgi:hypothetical protein
MARSFWSQLSRTSHLISRGSGDVAALQRGPGHYIKRRVRRATAVRIFRALDRLGK